jgi:hypothetical protein
MASKTNVRGWSGRADLIPLTCVNCGKPFNCPPEYLDQLINANRPFHPLCFFNGKWRSGITEEMKERMKRNDEILRSHHYIRGRAHDEKRN